MFKTRQLVALVLIATLAVSLAPVSAAGPIYTDLPDLEGQEVVIAVENLYLPFQFEEATTGEVMGYE
ncbi:MAG: hypothetical protein JXJ20_04470, partial [Anaerolineae bacterium]|nr:hypothetical protein [Anaerolineae bacterium]